MTAVTNSLRRYNWATLNKQQVGAYAEYFVKMELTMYGFEVYSTEVDDHGIDFVARRGTGPFIEVQVKSLRSAGYVFMEKGKFQLAKNLYLAFGLLSDGHPPELYLIPSTTWNTPSGVFVSRDYVGKKSKPEWGLNVSKKSKTALQPYLFHRTLDGLSGPT